MMDKLDGTSRDRSRFCNSPRSTCWTYRARAGPACSFSPVANPPSVRTRPPSFDSKSEKVYHLVGKRLKLPFWVSVQKKQGSDEVLQKKNATLQGCIGRRPMGSYHVTGEGAHRDHELLKVHARLNLEVGPRKKSACV